MSTDTFKFLFFQFCLPYLKIIYNFFNLFDWMLLEFISLFFIRYASSCYHNIVTFFHQFQMSRFHLRMIHDYVFHMLWDPTSCRFLHSIWRWQIFIFSAYRANKCNKILSSESTVRIRNILKACIKTKAFISVPCIKCFHAPRFFLPVQRGIISLSWFQLQWFP